MLGDLHQRTLTGISQPVVSQRIKNVRDSHALIVSQGVSSSRPLFFKQQSRTLSSLVFGIARCCCLQLPKKVIENHRILKLLSVNDFEQEGLCLFLLTFGVHHQAQAFQECQVYIIQASLLYHFIT